MKKKVYLASPMGFAESTKQYMYQYVIPMLESLGLEVIDPWKLTLQQEIDEVYAIKDMVVREEAFKTLRFVIGKRNAQGIAEADFLVANLDGQEMDSGTASEIGAGSITGKTVFAWRNDLRQSGELGAVINLQVEYFITVNGGSISRSLENLERTLRKYLGLPEEPVFALA
ncbi:MAG: nucleoside 2-deoxyribosyltransferase [Patescibacteria group bacterium]|jgi:nucleoside 2-deoxyribosyltransferase|nr:nucleoside 2-deoxyribosyltransferase [Patescibacteria group bacterium]